MTIHYLIPFGLAKMNLLFDTHSFLWWNDSLEMLPPLVLSACQDTRNQLFLSVVSAWEIQIKQQIGKLRMKSPLAEMIERQVDVNKLRILPVRIEHILAIENLPMLHRDPFDRLLVAQAITENHVLISRDRSIQQYSLTTLWA